MNDKKWSVYLFESISSVTILPSSEVGYMYITLRIQSMEIDDQKTNQSIDKIS